MHHGIWALPGPEIEPMSPALAGDFLPLSHQGSLKRALLELHKVSILGQGQRDFKLFAGSRSRVCMGY